jgi:hypothetical protein
VICLFATVDYLPKLIFKLGLARRAKLGVFELVILLKVLGEVCEAEGVVFLYSFFEGFAQVQPV